MRLIISIGVLILIFIKSTYSQMNQGVWECTLAELKIDSGDLLITGNPQIISSPYGNAIQFDGKDDGYFLTINPLINLS